MSLRHRWRLPWSFRSLQSTALPAVRSVRGRGLLIGAELDRPVGPVVDACREQGLLVLSAGPDVLRLTPPLVVDAAQVAEALTILEGVLAS